MFVTSNESRMYEVSSNSNRDTRIVTMPSTIARGGMKKILGVNSDKGSGITVAK